MNDANAPLITYLVLAYEQRLYIHDAVQAVFDQDYDPLEIILSDDCSTDGTFEVMKKMADEYRGPHRVIVNKNEENLGRIGLGAHINKLMSMANGKIIVFAAGDDISLKNRTSKLVEMWGLAGCPSGSLHSAANTIAHDARDTGLLIHGDAGFGNQSVLQCVCHGAVGVLGATHAITRDVYDVFGLIPDTTLFEDRTLAFRSLLLGRVLYCPEPLVKYRVHTDNISGQAIYKDPRKWSRWNRGVQTCCQALEADYRCSLMGKKPDKKILRQLKYEMWRARQSRAMLEGVLLQRLWAAIIYSMGMKVRSDQLAFIVSTVFGKNAAIYRMGSAVWRSLKWFR